MTLAAPVPAAATAPPIPRMQRARGLVRAAFARRAGTSRLVALRQEGSAKLRLPRSAGAPRAVLINTAGGWAGGDAFRTEIAVGGEAEAAITTQACERVYRSTGAPARVATRLEVGAGGRLDWLPQETILFDGGRLERRLEADLAEDATLLAVEAVILGRGAMGETVRRGSLRDDWRVRRGGRLIHAEALRLEGEIAAAAARPATLDGARAFATLLLVAPEAEARLDATRAALGAAGGASAWNGKIVARAVAPDGLALRRAVVPALAALRDGRPLPRFWSL
jgi:urease accessory protein